jgi:replicative DNA helicase
MERLLRGVIDFDGAVTQENLGVNYRRLAESNLKWMKSSDERIFAFVKDYFARQLELPQSQRVLDYFQREDDLEVIERVQDIRSAHPYVRTNYCDLLKELVERQNTIKMEGVIKQVQDIIHKGITIGKGKDLKVYKGLKDALVFFNQKASDLIPTMGEARISADARVDTVTAWQTYEIVKVNKDKSYGKFTGLQGIDQVCKGIKPGELWVHAAPPAGGKTMFAMNWAYNVTTRQRTNALYCSFEMPLVELEREIYTIHSAHPKWQKPENGSHPNPLRFDKVRDGELTPEEEEFYKQVLDDYRNNPEHCRFELWTPPSPTVADVQLHAEMLNKQFELGFIVLDYGELLKSTSTDPAYGNRYNSVIRAAKQMALHFDNDRGIGVLLLAQINRDGMKDGGKDVEKNDGKYKMFHLSQGNELEKAADVITTSYFSDKMKEEGQCIIANMKNRYNGDFQPLRIRIDFPSRKMYNLAVEDIISSSMGVDGVEDMCMEMI